MASKESTWRERSKGLGWRAEEHQHSRWAEEEEEGGSRKELKINGKKGSKRSGLRLMNVNRVESHGTHKASDP